MNLTQHFTLAEMTVTQEGARRGLDNTPGSEEAHNLKRLCVYILEPLRTALGGPIVVTSGYRSPEVNLWVGGARGSHHLTGRAADIIAPGYTALEVCQLAKSLDLPAAQIIHEFGQWCHISLAVDIATAPRQCLTAKCVDGVTRYSPGLFA